LAPRGIAPTRRPEQTSQRGLRRIDEAGSLRMPLLGVSGASELGTHTREPGQPFKTWDTMPDPDRPFLAALRLFGPSPQRWRANGRRRRLHERAEHERKIVMKGQLVVYASPGWARAMPPGPDARVKITVE
jgi:hypothetical protein